MNFDISFGINVRGTLFTVQEALPAADDRILGFTAFGAEAGEVTAVVQVAMAAGLPYTGLRDAVLTHPPVAEGLTVLFSDVPAKP